VVSEPVLHGVEWESLRNPLAYKNIVNGSFQKSFANWFNQRIGFRSYFIRTYNQFYYFFFNTSPNTDVVFGKNHQLYLSSYIKRYYSEWQFEDSLLTEQIKKMKKAQDLFKERGIYLILLISPSKASVYKEDIPDQFIKNDIKPHQGHDKIVMLLDKYNVNYVDGYKLFIEYKNTSKYPVFPKSGIHWNLLGTSLVMNEVFDKIEVLSKKPLAKYHFNHINMDDSPEGKEDDIALLLNTWTNFAYGPFPHPNFEKSVKKNSFKPNTLIIGSSFTQQIAEILDRYDMASNLGRFYYYSTYDTYSPRESRPIGKLKWDQHVFNRSLIIIESNEELLPGRYHFIDDALTMMNLHNLNNIDFSYINDKYIEPLLIDGKIIYRLKKEVSGPGIFLTSKKIKYKAYTNYVTATFLAKDFVNIKCSLNPGKLISGKSIDAYDGYKQYTYIFETIKKDEKDYELRFLTEDTDVRKKDSYIKDVKLYSTSH
jgi:hypothetical protein